MTRGWPLRTRGAMLLLVVCALLGLALGQAKAPVDLMEFANRFKEAGTPIDLEDPNSKLSPLKINRRMSDLSLTVREQVDFLLTPAMLVQEAVSEDIVLTYPEE
jgi:hypothetical protein